MKKELIDIIKKLKESPSVLISVINKDTGQPLVRSFSNKIEFKKQNYKK